MCVACKDLKDVESVVLTDDCCQLYLLVLWCSVFIC